MAEREHEAAIQGVGTFEPSEEARKSLGEIAGAETIHMPYTAFPESREGIFGRSSPITEQSGRSHDEATAAMLKAVADEHAERFPLDGRQ
jgi:hypothetical protein